MAESFRVVIDGQAIDDFFTSDEMRGLIEDDAQQPTSTAAANAPRLTGAGADSIAAKMVLDRSRHEWTAQIGWQRTYYYMYFHEKGTVTLPARPFLVPALGI